MVRRVCDHAPETGDPAAAEHDVLRLRLRVEELQHELAQARREQAAARAQLDDLSRSRVWRATAKAHRLARRARPDVLVAASAGRVPAGVTRIPLAGMPVETDGGATRWSDEIAIDDVGLPGLLADPPLTVSWRLVPRGRLRLRAFAGIRTAEALGNVGGVRFVAALLDEDGREVRRAERVVDPAGFPEQRRWLPVKLDLGGLPEREHRLVLITELPDGAQPEWAWAAWGDPVLLAGAPTPSARLGNARTLLRRDRASAPGPHPRVSFLVPVHDPAPALLERTIASVFAQTSPEWQLCLSDDGSTDPAVLALIARAAEDPRVAVTRAEQAAGISAATNAALGLATGEFVAPLDHDDTLAPDALAVVGARLAADPALDAVYTDNDKELPGGVRFAPALKPDWSPEYLRACMYTLHLGVYRRALVEQLGGLRSAFDGSQDHDLVLRLADAGARIGHVPQVLYHWGVHPGSAAQGEHAKPEAYERGRAAVEDHLRRTGVPAHAQTLPFAGRFRVVHESDPDLGADLIVPLPAGVTEEAAAAIAALARDGRPGVRVTVVPGRGAAPEMGERVTVLPAGPGVWGDLAAAGIAATAAPVVVLFEDLCTPDADGWLDELAGLVREPAIGAAGALVVDAAGRTVHAGVALPRGVPLAVHVGADLNAEDPAPELTMVTNRSAAAGVVAFDREALAAGGGVVRGMDRLALTATTLAVGAAGPRIVLSPHARLRLATAGPVRGAVLDVAEVTRIADGRGDRPDPFYNPNLWADRAAHVVPLALQRTGFADRPA